MLLLVVFRCFASFSVVSRTFYGPIRSRIIAKTYGLVVRSGVITDGPSSHSRKSSGWRRRWGGNFGRYGRSSICIASRSSSARFLSALRIHVVLLGHIWDFYDDRPLASYALPENNSVQAGQVPERFCVRAPIDI